ncbi:MAG: cysteine hydrolase [Proteobacteria bacterium]|nr:cysteine hydrolase [Pseudomonadota bacterium]
MEKTEINDTIIDEWSNVAIPPPPDLKKVSVDPKVTAFLVLDIQNQNCGARPRCMVTVPKIKKFLTEARARGMLIVYSLFRMAKVTDIIADVAPVKGEAVVKTGADKFFRTDLERILEEKNIQTVVLAGTAAHGAVLHTAAGAALRGLQVVVPVDGMSAAELYAEQYTAWHLVNSPGTKSQTTLTRFDLITFS